MRGYLRLEIEQMKQFRDDRLGPVEKRIMLRLGFGIPAALRSRVLTVIDCLASLDPSRRLPDDAAEAVMAVVDGTGSDLHLTAGLPPTIRVNGELRPLKGYRKLLPKDLQEIIYAMLTQKQREQFESNQELDLSYALPGRARFRVNVYFQRGALGAARLDGLRRVALRELDGLAQRDRRGLGAGRDARGRHARASQDGQAPRRPDALGDPIHLGIDHRRVD